jgi:glycosyltransferase involved in cell wall biosynthesis
MPQPHRPASLPFEQVEQHTPFQNPLAKDRPRVLMILTWFTMGGADKFNLRMTEQLARRGWDITLAGTLPGDQSWLPQFTALTPDLHVLPHYVPHRARPLYLRYLIESRDPDVVLISNSESGYLYLPYLRAHCPRPAYVDYNHMEEPYWKNGGYPRYGAACQDRLDLNIVSSGHLKNWMAGRGADPDRIEVCTTNEDAAQWKPDRTLREATRERLRIPPARTVLLYAGRVCEQKQPKVFAATLAELHRRGLEFVAIVAGDGPDLPALRDAARRHGFEDRARFLGAVPNAEMRSLAAAADIFFLPSLWEGISLAVYEAMSAGLAIIGGDVGGQRELVTPECGTLIARSDQDDETRAYAEALAPLIADRSLAHRMGECGRRRILDHFQLSHMGDRLEALFARARELAASRPREPIPLSVGHEIAERGVEYLRIHEFCDYLWVERERLRQMAGGPAQHSPGPPPAGSLGPESAAELELAYIEGSRLFGLVTAAKRNPLYRAIARVRWGSNWSLMDPQEPAAQRLARIKCSRSFRLIQALKSTGAYKVYALRKYGSLPTSSEQPTHLNGVASDPDRRPR